jgi:hypothetical protein
MDASALVAIEGSWWFVAAPPGRTFVRCGSLSTLRTTSAHRLAYFTYVMPATRQYAPMLTSAEYAWTSLFDIDKEGGVMSLLTAESMSVDVPEEEAALKKGVTDYRALETQLEELKEVAKVRLPASWHPGDGAVVGHTRRENRPWQSGEASPVRRNETRHGGGARGPRISRARRAWIDTVVWTCNVPRTCGCW